MRIIRSHVDQPLAVGQRITLPEDSSLHLLRVLRLEPGDAVTLFNGDGFDYTARLLTAAKRGAEAEITGREPVPRESPLRITLVQGVARGEKMDLVLQKATELGVDAFSPVITERTEVKLDADRAEKRMAHWRGVVAAACEQSGRAVLPRLSEPKALSAYAGAETADIKLVLDPSGKRSRWWWARRAACPSGTWRRCAQRASAASGWGRASCARKRRGWRRWRRCRPFTATCGADRARRIRRPCRPSPSGSAAPGSSGRAPTPGRR
jgi:16S rRNA (uracil1498-N3)-methyltransferase